MIRKGKGELACFGKAQYSLFCSFLLKACLCHNKKELALLIGYKFLLNTSVISMLKYTQSWPHIHWFCYFSRLESQMTADIQTILQILQRQSTLIPPAYSMVTAGAEYQQPAIRFTQKLHPVASIKTDRSFSPSSQVCVCPIKELKEALIILLVHYGGKKSQQSRCLFISLRNMTLLFWASISALDFWCCNFKKHIFCESFRDLYNDLIIRSIYLMIMHVTKISRNNKY